MKCNICNKEDNNLDRDLLICDDCLNCIAERWDIIDRYYIKEDNDFIEYIVLKKTITNEKITMKNILVFDEYGCYHKMVENETT